MKIGLVYAAKGQDTQHEILRNEGGSIAYEEFLNGLGEYISLKTHLGFQAGLKYKIDGEKSIYYSDPLTEVMYHVTTLMPNANDDDNQVISKKRYFHANKDNKNE